MGTTTASPTTQPNTAPYNGFSTKRLDTGLLMPLSGAYSALVVRRPDDDVPSLGRALLFAALLLLGSAIMLGGLVLIALTQLPENFM